jgi:carbamoyltransferase
MNILGISAFYHDSAACLVRDGRIVAAAQEERFTRKKQDFSFPRNSINYCLQEAGVTSKDLDIVAFYDKPFLGIQTILRTYGVCSLPESVLHYVDASVDQAETWMKNLIMEDSVSKEVIFPEHLNPAASAFPSLIGSAILTIDGVGRGDDEHWVGKIYRSNPCEIHFPHSLGSFCSAFVIPVSKSFGNTVIGLAPYRERYKDLILELMDLKEDGSFMLNMKYLIIAGMTMTNGNSGLFGGPRGSRSRC